MLEKWDLPFCSETLNQQVLSAYIGELDFVDMDFDLALRLLLFCFRLPGEAQKIERILEKFASHYCSQNPESVFVSHEAAWALAYALIMLNTDRHSPQVKKKMTKQQFIHNCRGINDGKSFPPEYLGIFFL
jgi:brefeldin A-inhibited guanine nucleotide-exchange protein